MKCDAYCRWCENGYCTVPDDVQITKDGGCDSFTPTPGDLHLPRESDEYIAVYDDGTTVTYFCKGVGNPCGCGSNCFHYRCKDGVIRGYCNACGEQIYEVKPEYYEEHLHKHKWKKVEPRG